MLLIDPGKGVISVRQDAAPVPYVLKDFGGQALRANAYLSRSTRGDLLAPLLIRELTNRGDVNRIGASRPALILEEVAHLVARGSIEVGERLPNTVTAVFRVGDPSSRDPGQAVRFAREDVAVDFQKRYLGAADAVTAITAALAHPKNARREKPADANTRDLWLVRLLMARQLGLFPIVADLSLLRFAWIDSVPPANILPPPPPVVVGGGQKPIQKQDKPVFFDLKIILFGPDNKPVSGAEWAVTGFKGEKGKTGGDGAITFKDIGEARTAALKVTLPPLPKLVPAPAAPAAAAAAKPPPYPAAIVAADFLPAEGKAKGPKREHRWALSLVDVEDMQLATGEQLDTANDWRMKNLGFRWNGDSTEPVKAYQRWYMGRNSPAPARWPISPPI